MTKKQFSYFCRRYNLEKMKDLNNKDTIPEQLETIDFLLSAAWPRGAACGFQIQWCEFDCDCGTAAYDELIDF